jgi:hypothetical protein
MFLFSLLKKDNMFGGYWFIFGILSHQQKKPTRWSLFSIYVYLCPWFHSSVLE